MERQWSDEELRAAVKAYLEMHRKESKGDWFVKKRYIEELTNRFDRTIGSFQYRMHNISYVFSLQGRRWIAGITPYSHVGTNVVKKLKRLISEVEGQKFGSSDSFQADVNGLLKRPIRSPPEGNLNPDKKEITVTEFVRNPEVVVWVLKEADGICECCEDPAPFEKEDGVPFLEVHHVQRLADGGPDTISNAVAVCPNCHRRLHFGKNKQSVARALRTRINRLTE